jgi:hypothetical protein
MTQGKAWTIGGLLALFTAGGLSSAGLELWSSPEPCQYMAIRVGPQGASCPHADHETRETWSDDFGTLHLECLCP